MGGIECYSRTSALRTSISFVFCSRSAALFAAFASRSAFSTARYIGIGLEDGTAEFELVGLLLAVFLALPLRDLVIMILNDSWGV